MKDGALRSLLISFTKKCRKHLLKGKYSLIVCDGSAVDIFRNLNDPDSFFEPNGKSTRGFSQMADRVGADTPVIYLCDRGYASYHVSSHVIENSQFFLIRCTDVKAGKILGFPLDMATELDYHADRILSRSQLKKKRLHPEPARQYRYVCRDVPMDYITEERTEYGISLRVIRIELSEGCYENLITNLSDLDFNIDDFKDLYHLGWDEMPISVFHP